MALTAGFGLCGCASQPAEADYDLIIRRGGKPWAEAAVIVQPLDRRNFPVNPIEIGPAIDYVSRPEPQGTMAGRTDAYGHIRVRLIESFTTKFYVQGQGAAAASILLEPFSDSTSNGLWLLKPVTQDELGELPVSIEVQRVR